MKNQPAKKPMDSKSLRKIIDEARRLLKQGEKAAESESDEQWQEYERVYPAQDFLVRQAYEETDNAELQAKFHSVIPESAILQEKKKGLFRDLQSRAVKTRLEAAKQIANESHAELGIVAQLWLRHPDTVDLLCKLVQTETDPEILVHLIRTLGVIHFRVFEHPGIYDALKPYLESDDKKLLMETVAATASIRSDDKWKFVQPLFDTCKNQKLMSSLLSHIGTEPDHLKFELIESLTKYALNSKLNTRVFAEVMEGICGLTDQSNASRFEELVSDVRDKRFRKGLNQEIESGSYDHLKEKY